MGAMPRGRLLRSRSSANAASRVIRSRRDRTPEGRLEPPAAGAVRPPNVREFARRVLMPEMNQPFASETDAVRVRNIIYIYSGHLSMMINLYQCPGAEKLAAAALLGP